MLDYICLDQANLGINTLYLIGDHDHFYEQYQFEYIMMIEDEEKDLVRLYQRDTKKGIYE